MKVFLDTNILLDFVTEREGVEEACDILQLGEDGKINLSTSYLSMANTAYVARRGRSREELYAVLAGLSDMIQVLSMDEEQLRQAIAHPVSDFEDMLQYVCAMTHHCDVIISRNKKHFSFSHIPVYSPAEFLIQITVLPDSAG